MFANSRASGRTPSIPINRTLGVSWACRERERHNRSAICRRFFIFFAFIVWDKGREF